MEGGLVFHGPPCIMMPLASWTVSFGWFYEL